MILVEYVKRNIKQLKCKDHDYIVVEEYNNEWARVVNCKRVRRCTKCGRLHFEKYF